MNPLKSALIALTILGLGAPARAAQCTAESAAGTAALVELYTSEGCDSCPAADRWLSSLGGRRYAPDRVVPIALHVDYWDYIGWKDPYARHEFSARQRMLARQRRARLVYTPQVLVQGRDFAWRSRDFEGEVARINAQPARAKIALRLAAPHDDAFEVEASVELLDRSQTGGAALYLAAYESKLVSHVAAGENRGKTLAHDYVVHQWRGPYALADSGRIVEDLSLPLLPNTVAGNSGVVAFVQNTRNGEVLQALMLPFCGS